MHGIAGRLGAAPAPDVSLLDVRHGIHEAALIESMSVIIPTRNRVESLRRLMSSLETVDVPRTVRIEIILVNNGSTDDTSRMLQEQLQKFARFSLRVFDQVIPGKCNALNIALRHAEGDVLIVIDDDVTLDSKCLSSHIRTYESTDFAAIQGRILPGKDPSGRLADPSRSREYNIPTLDYGVNVIQIRGLTGTNMSFKREVLDHIGLFDVRLGPGASGFSEDSEFSLRVRNAGYKIGYTPDAVVYHELDPKRYGRAYNRDVEYRKGLSRSIYRSDSIAFRVIPDLLMNCIRYCLYRLFGRTQKAYKTEGRIMKCWGYLMGKSVRRQSTS